MKIRFKIPARHYRRRLTGQGMVEYALLLGLLVLAVVGIVAALGPLVGQAFNSAQNGVTPDRPADVQIGAPGALPPAPPLTQVPPAPPPSTSTPTASLIDDQNITYVIAYTPLFSEPIA